MRLPARFLLCAAALATGAAPPEFCERPADVDGACAVASSRLRGTVAGSRLLVEPALHALPAGGDGPARLHTALAAHLLRHPRVGLVTCALGPGANARTLGPKTVDVVWASPCASVPRAARSPRARSSTASRAITARRGRDDLLLRRCRSRGPRAVRGAGTVGCDRARCCRRVSRPRATSPRACGRAAGTSRWCAARRWRSRPSRARAARPRSFVRKMADRRRRATLAAVCGRPRRDGARPTCPRPSPTSRVTTRRSRAPRR